MNTERMEKGLYWDRAWKLVEGCSPVSAGCDNCWSEAETVMRSYHPNEKISQRANSVMVFDDGFSGLILCREDNLDLPLRVKKPTVWAIWNDLFHEDVPDDFRDRAYAVMALCPQHTFLVLTKRAEGMAEYWSNALVLPRIKCKDERLSKESFRPEWPLPNVWHGVTAENQEQADARIPHLLNVPGKRFISIEPMLGPINLMDIPGPYSKDPLLHAVLLGGESGKEARPMHPDWVRSVRDQCAAAGVPFFFKQWGEWLPAEQTADSGTAYRRCDNGELLAVRAIQQNFCTHPDPYSGPITTARIGKKKAGRTLDGRLHNALPWGQS